MEDEQATTPPEPEPDPRLVAVQEAADALIAACNDLPDNANRGHAIAHARSVPIWASQALGEG